MPDDVATALAQVKAAQQQHNAFPPSKQRDHLAWMLEAKREDTRTKRIAQAVEWLAEDEPRHWKYPSC